MIFARWNGLGCNGEKLHVGSHPEGSSAVMVGGGRALGLIVPKKEVVVTGSSWFVLAIGSSEAISMRVTKPLSDINIISGVKLFGHSLQSVHCSIISKSAKCSQVRCKGNTRPCKALQGHPHIQGTPYHRSALHLLGRSL